MSSISMFPKAKEVDKTFVCQYTRIMWSRIHEMYKAMEVVLSMCRN
jgi:hypothetical protein